MFSCALHNWFSYDFPCPACKRESTTGGDIIINTEGTSTEYLTNKCETCKHLQSLLKEKEDEIGELKKHAIAGANVAMEWTNVAADKEIKIQQLQSERDKANEEIKKYVGIGQALMGAAKKIEKLEALAEAAGKYIGKIQKAENYHVEKNNYNRLKQQL